MKATLWKLIHKWRDATTTESAWIARDQIDIELDKIDELRAALQERDAEITAIRSSQQIVIARLEATGNICAAQRNVLEQALEALNRQRTWYINEIGDRERETTSPSVLAAITAIQEVLA